MSIKLSLNERLDNLRKEFKKDYDKKQLYDLLDEVQYIIPLKEKENIISPRHTIHERDKILTVMYIGYVGGIDKIGLGNYEKNIINFKREYMCT